MAHKGPHISISPDYVVNRILRINIDDFAEWPESVRHLAIAIAEELFLVAYNPFINVETVRNSVHARFERESMALAHYFANAIGEGITMFWSAYEAERSFREELISALRNILPNECILSSPSALVASATDATDLRMELPLLVVEPDSAEQVAALVKLANDMKFALIPRGGGSGMTGGAVPARKRTVIVSLTRLTKIGPIDLENMTVTVEAGAITQNVIKAVDAAGALFSVDPASKQASSIGGNVSENAGGPSAFEYGTTLDNLLWWRMVTPTGEIISVERENHPRHKILPEETAVFVVKDISGGVRNVIHLRGDEIRLPGLGKDVTNKALGGLPGMQKEGVDGIITEACFIIHPKPKFKRVMVLEFFGRSMHPAAVVVRELVGLRNRIRQEGDYAHLSALEEFNAKYVQAIEYKRKSQKYEGLPISVIILQVDGDDPYLLDKCPGRRGRRTLLGRPAPPVGHRQAHPRLQPQRGRGHPHGPHPGLRPLPRTAQPGMHGPGLPPRPAGSGPPARLPHGRQGIQPRVLLCLQGGVRRQPAGRAFRYRALEARRGLFGRHGPEVRPSGQEDRQDPRLHGSQPHRGGQPHACR